MASWGEMARMDPTMAARGEALLTRPGFSGGMLTTVAGDDLPRTHPVDVGIVDDRLYVVVLGHSAKARDLSTDGRYALHAHLDPSVPTEFLVRGRGRVVTDPAVRTPIVERWSFSPADEDLLVELEIEHAVLGERPDADAWPPRYTSWRARSVSGVGA